MGRKVYQILICICCLLAACVKDKPDNLPPSATKGSVYIICEGNFGNGDASLYVYNQASDSVYGDIYMQANNQSMGDVLQSMVRIGNQFFLCINNSDKVIIINAENKKTAGVISIPKPRFILPISETKAYVSSLYSNKVYIINPQAQTITGSIELPYKNTEGMCLYNSDAIVCTWDTACNKIFKINTITDRVTDSFKIAGFSPQEVVTDKQQMLWVLSGNKSKGKAGALTRIDPSTGAMLKPFQFSADVDALKPVFNKAKDTLYFIEVNYLGNTANNGIYRMPIDAAGLPAQPFIAAKQYQYFWGLGIEPSTGFIYVGDPKGFAQKGDAYVYKQDGTLVTTLSVGLGPGHFYFDK
jgi:DNA-binding beta-propeller fold protein YncE